MKRRGIMQLHFTKMEGIGNDYIYFDGINQEIPMDKEFIMKISDRHFLSLIHI